VAAAELGSHEGRTEPPDRDLPLEVRQRLHRRVPFALPVIAIVPVVIAVVLATTLAPARAGAAALGAAGWLAALALRGPAAAFVSRMPKENAPTFMALISGPAEELVRLLLVLFGVSGFGNLLWAGFGWATIEVVYTLVTALAVRRLLLDTSAKAAGCRYRWGGCSACSPWLRCSVRSNVPGRVCCTPGSPCCSAGIRGWCWSPCRCTVPPTWSLCG
jgi:hypothetical protein